MSQITASELNTAVQRLIVGGTVMLGSFLVCGCSIAPTKVSPSTGLATLSTCSSAADKVERYEAEAAVSTLSFDLLSAYVSGLEVKRTSVAKAVPGTLQDDKVVESISKLLTHQHFLSVKSLVDGEIVAKGLKLDDVNVIKWHSTIDRAIAESKPKSLSAGNFKTFFEKSVSPNNAAKKSRVVLYESYYFNGSFVDRFGSKLNKPTLSLTITDQEISGAINAFVEALADDLFPQTKVWTGTGGKYYPGGTTNRPSFLQYLDDTGGSPTNLTQPIVDKGCGMTEIKADVLNYLSGKAATWAAGEAGVILGSVGGANVGALVVFGKLSIGDNKALETIVQTVLSTAAKRATFEATVPVLLAIDQKSSATTLQDIIDQLVFKKGS